MADLVTTAQCKTHLNISGTAEDAWLAQVITQASAQIQTYCNTQFSSTSVTENVDGNFDDLIVQNAPIISVTSVTDIVSNTAMAGTDYSVDLGKGLIYISIDSTNYLLLANKWGYGRRRWTVVYTYGYSSVPAQVQLACIMLVAYYRACRAPGFSSERLGDYSYTKKLGSSGMPQEVESMLSPFRMHVI